MLETFRGIGAKEPTRYLVIQTEDLNDTLPTIVAAPIDETTALGGPLSVVISAKESGCSRAAVIELAVLAGIPRDRFGIRPVGRASAATMARVDHGLQLLLGMNE